MVIELRFFRWAFRFTMVNLLKAELERIEPGGWRSQIGMWPPKDGGSLLLVPPGHWHSETLACLDWAFATGQKVSRDQL